MNDDLIKGILDLIQSQDPNEKIGGIMAIDELIEVQYDETKTIKVSFLCFLLLVSSHPFSLSSPCIQFVNYLRFIFKQQMPQDLIIFDLAAKALGLCSSLSVLCSFCVFSIHLYVFY